MLASASPVFYSRFYEKTTQNQLKQFLEASFRSRRSNFVTSADHSDRGITVVDVNGVSAGAFFEFIRFIYTDQVNITLENTQELCMLADDYRIAGLHEKVMDYIRSVSANPDKAFKCLG